MSPKTFISLPPATPVRVADVYLTATCGAGEGDPAEGSDAADDVREKGELIAVERRKGLDEVATGTGAGTGDMALGVTGGRDGAWTEVGRPPGVSARVRVMPMPAEPSRSKDCE